MSWINADAESWGNSVGEKGGLKIILREELSRHKTLVQIERHREILPIKAITRALYMIHENRTEAAIQDGKRVSMENRAREVREAAAALRSALARIDDTEAENDPTQTHILEGSINGTGLVALSQECTARLIQRCDLVLGFHGKDRGGQRRSTDIAGVLMIARAWRDWTGKEPRAKGSFGAFLNSVFATLGWDQVSPNTLQHWMDSQ